MKKLELVVMISIFAVSLHGFCDQNTNTLSEEKLLAQLVAKQGQVVNSYEGFIVNALIVGKSPLTTVTYVQVDKKRNSSNTKQLLLISTDANTNEKQVVLSQVKDMEGFKPSKVVARNGNIFFDDEMDQSKLVELDYYDVNNQLRMSEWRMTDTGFSIMTVLLSETGKPLTLTLYSHLKFNKPATNRYFPEDGAFESYRHYFTESEGLQLNNIIDLQKFIKVVLEEKFKK